MLVVDRVVLKRLQQSDQIVTLRQERAVGSQSLLDGSHDSIRIRHVSEAVAAGDECGLSHQLPRGLTVLGEELLERGNARARREIGDVSWLYSHHSHASSLVRLQQSTVVGADVDDGRSLRNLQELDRLLGLLIEVVHEQTS